MQLHLAILCLLRSAELRTHGGVQLALKACIAAGKIWWLINDKHISDYRWRNNTQLISAPLQHMIECLCSHLCSVVFFLFASVELGGDWLCRLSPPRMHVLMKHDLKPVLLLQLLALMRIGQMHCLTYLFHANWCLQQVLEDEPFAHGNLADFRDEQTANASLIALTRTFICYLCLASVPDDDSRIHVLWNNFWLIALLKLRFAAFSRWLVSICVFQSELYESSRVSAWLGRAQDIA